MLGKLLKYDLKYGVKIFTLLHFVFLLVCIFGRFFFMDRLDFDNVNGVFVSSLAIFASLIMFLYMAVAFCTWLIITFRFYRNLFTGEGYLTWTLPATGTEHLWSKILSGYIWSALDLVITSLGALILVTGKNVTEAYRVIAPEVTKELGMPISTFALYFFVFILISCIGSVITTYFCVTLGQLFPAHRVLGAIAVYLIYSLVIQILSFILMAAFGLFPNPAFTDSSGIAVADYTLSVLALSTVIVVITSVIQYFVIHHIMKKKINLI